MLHNLTERIRGRKWSDKPMPEHGPLKDDWINAEYAEAVTQLFGVAALYQEMTATELHAIGVLNIDPDSRLLDDGELPQLAHLAPSSAQITPKEDIADMREAVRIAYLLMPD